MDKKLLETGKIVTTQGIKGEVKVLPWSDTPEFLTEFDEFYVGDGETPMAVEWARASKNCVFLKFEHIDDINAAIGLVGKVIYIDKEDVELPEGTYFIDDLVGLEVTDADTGVRYGELTEVLQTGANDVYTIKQADGKTVLIPAIRDVIVTTDIGARRMTIRPLKGLFE